MHRNYIIHCVVDANEIQEHDPGNYTRKIIIIPENTILLVNSRKYIFHTLIDTQLYTAHWWMPGSQYW